jgi:FixJ family two-component response regulator
VDNARPLIAIVDDEESVRRAIKRLICAVGFDVDVFCSGSDFLNSLTDRVPRCVVLDLHMPEMSGFDVQDELKHAGYSIPVIAITGHDTPASQPRALAGGAVAYLRKPVKGSTLLGIIREAIDAPSP